MSLKEIVGGGLMGLVGLAASILGLVIHVWTIIIAFTLSGLFSAVLTLIFPVLSELYWFFEVGFTFGFNAVYCISIMTMVGLIIIAGLLVIIILPQGK
jgi:hypothetical protein